jgi:F-type H+-transporting ATPase subunit epsilon
MPDIAEDDGGAGAENDGAWGMQPGLRHQITSVTCSRGWARLSPKTKAALNRHGCQLENALHVRPTRHWVVTELTVARRYNKFAQITARAVRSSLKEEQRLAAEKRGLTSLRYQRWENGKGSAQVRIVVEKTRFILIRLGCFV